MRALTRLVGLGLLETEASGALRLHRLLAAFVQEVGADAQAQGAVEQVLSTKVNRLNAAGHTAPLLALQTHLRHVMDQAQPRADDQAAALCTNLGYHLQARPYYVRALAIVEQGLGPQHPATAQSLHNLGTLLYDTKWN